MKTLQLAAQKNIFYTFLAFAFTTMFLYFFLFEHGHHLQIKVKTDQELLSYKELTRVIGSSKDIATARKITGVLKDLNIQAVLIEPSVLLTIGIYGQIGELAPFLKKHKNESRFFTFMTNYTRPLANEKRCEKFIPNNKTKTASDSYLCSLTDDIVTVVMATNIKKNFVIIGTTGDVPKRFSGLVSKKNIFFGGHDTLFDWYGTWTLTDNLVVPKHPMHFLRQLKYSRYVPCNEERRQDFLKKYPTKRNIEKETDYSLYLKELKEVARLENVPFWITSGILLGWHRQCGVIPYTHDFDISMWASNLSLQLMNKFFESKFIRPTFSIGKPSFGYILRLNTSVDLAFVYPSVDSAFIATYDFGNNVIYRSVLPNMKLCSGQLLDMNTLVPCNAEEMLNAEYGPDGWFHPNTDYYYVTGAKNLVLHEKLTEARMKNVVKHF